MDEATTSLSSREAEALCRVIRDLKDCGVSIIYIGPARSRNLLSGSWFCGTAGTLVNFRARISSRKK